jgi:membrane protease YdiL (CAAX protease family)
MGGTLCWTPVEAEAVQPRPRASRIRLYFWILFVGLIALINYAARFSGGSSVSNKTTHDAVYSYSTFVGGTILYAVWLGIVLAIAVDAFGLLALRRPRTGWLKALGLAGAAVAAVFAVEGLVSLLPLPQKPGQEQGLTPTHWEPAHAGAFAANLVLFAVIAPFVEELTFRGLGQSLLNVFVGRLPSILLVGIAFGLAHGLVEALLVLVPFGIALAVVRDRTDSVYPGMLVHGLFNGTALVLAVLS